MESMNLAIIASRRPELLLETLSSFSENLLDHIDLKQVRVNIDPIFGDEVAQANVISIVKSFFPKADINLPKSPGFTQAVQWVWSGMSDGPFLHLEDDWVCLGKIPIVEILKDMNDNTKAVILLSETHGMRGMQRESVRVRKKKFLGITYSRQPIPTFGTSPCIADGAFAREVASRFDLAFDPEKQMRDDVNPYLCSYLSQYRYLFQSQGDGSPLIEDIGRKWQEANGVKKVVMNGVSEWLSQ